MSPLKPEDFIEKRRKEQELQQPKPPEYSVNLTVEEVLNDKRYGTLLLKLIKQKRGGEALNFLNKAYRLDELPGEEKSKISTELIGYIEELNKILTQVENLSVYLTEENIKFMASKNEGFGKIVKAVGLEKIGKFLKDKMAELLIENPDKATTLYKKLQNIETAKGEIEKALNEIRALAREYNIPSSQLERLEQAVLRGDLDQIRNLIYNNLSGIRRTIDRLTGRKVFTEPGVESIAPKINAINEQLDAIDEALEEIASLIEFAKISPFIIEGAMPGKEQAQPISFVEARNIIGQLPDQEKLRAEWNDYLSKNSINENNVTEENKNSFIRQRIEGRVKGRGGLWSILESIFRQAVDSFLQPTTPTG